MSMDRVKLAKAAQPENADDEEGCRWWMAKASEGPAVHYVTGRKKTENGVSLTFVDGGYYISLPNYERFSPSSPDTFKLSAKVWTENAEGLISRQVAVSNASRICPSLCTRQCLFFGISFKFTSDCDNGQRRRTRLGDLPTV
jgi:hypothetical protein